MEHDLSGLLSLKDVNLTPAQIKCLMKQILEGMHQCHSSGVMHRDIKAANLLISNGELKLADFGLATSYRRRDTFSTNVVTLWYRAPELLLGQGSYGPKVDMWSAGCIFIELLTRQSPFPGSDERNQMELIFKMCGTPNEKVWPGVSKLPGWKSIPRVQYRPRLKQTFVEKVGEQAADLICKLLALDPEQRISASDALDHDYFWSTPMPCSPSELPKCPSMHEYEAKKSRENMQREAKRQRTSQYGATAAGAPPPHPHHPDGRQPHPHSHYHGRGSWPAGNSGRPSHGNIPPPARGTGHPSSSMSRSAHHHGSIPPLGRDYERRTRPPTQQPPFSSSLPSNQPPFLHSSSSTHSSHRDHGHSRHPHPHSHQHNHNNESVNRRYHHSEHRDHHHHHNVMVLEEEQAATQRPPSDHHESGASLPPLPSGVEPGEITAFAEEEEGAMLKEMTSSPSSRHHHNPSALLKRKRIEDDPDSSSAIVGATAVVVDGAHRVA
ncbi:Cyclindependent kinase, variant 2 [Balamuthia mandrillaris]